jgi:hypothetical protein
MIDARIIYYQKLLSEQGEVSYLCEERACGSSNYWANNILMKANYTGVIVNSVIFRGVLMLKDKTILFLYMLLKMGENNSIFI